MTVQSIKKISKYKFKITTDETCFSLSFKHLNQYGLEEGSELSDKNYEKIEREVLLPSAKKKTLDLLLKMDQSEKELRRKLALKYYPETVIDEAVSYVKKYNYINDERYAKNYVSYRSGGKSKKQVKMELQLKGIDKEKVEELVSESFDEEEALVKLIKKKIGFKTALDRTEMRKLMAYLYRRGFEGELIRTKIKEVLHCHEDEMFFGE